MKTFRSHDGRTVQARTPSEAMLKLWGPPCPLRLPKPGKTDYSIIGTGGYSGLGLSEESTR